MSAESWLFLFAACGAVGSIASVVQLWLAARPMNSSVVVDHPVVSHDKNFAVSRARLIVISGLLLFSLVLSIVGFYKSIVQPSTFTADTAERQTRAWLDKFRFSTTPLPSDPNTYFGFSVTSPNGVAFAVTRPKDFDQYIVIQGTVSLTDPRLKTLTAFQAEQLMRQLRIEIARLKVSSSDIGLPLTKVTVETTVPISNQLTQAVFMKSIDDIEFSERLAAETTEFQLNQMLGTTMPSSQ